MKQRIEPCRPVTYGTEYIIKADLKNCVCLSIFVIRNMLCYEIKFNLLVFNGFILLKPMYSTSVRQMLNPMTGSEMFKHGTALYLLFNATV